MTAPPVTTGTGAPTSRFRRPFRWIARAATALAVLGIVALLAAPVVVRGPLFGRLVERSLPKMRGQIQVGGGTWSWGALWALSRGRPAPLSLEGVRIVDPEGIEVLRVARLHAEIEVKRAPLHIVVHGLELEGGAWVFARMRTEAKVGFVAAFELAGAIPRHDGSASRPGGPSPNAPGTAEISVPDARLEHVTTTFDLPGWGLVLVDGHGDATLHARSGGGRAPVFAYEVRGADIPGGGKLRVLDGRAAVVLPFSRARVDRLGTSTDDPDGLRLEASGVVTGRSTLTLGARFGGLYGRSGESRQPGLTLEARFENADDAIQAIARSKGLAGLPSLGSGASLRARLEGPFSGPSGEVTLGSAALGRVHLEAEVVAAEAVARGGPTVAAGLTFDRFDPGRLLPPALAPIAGGRLDGHLRGRYGPQGAAALEEVALVFTRPPGAAPAVLRVRGGSGRFDRPARRGDWVLDLAKVQYAKGTIALPRLRLPFYGGELAARGKIVVRDGAGTRWLTSPEVDLTLGARGLALDRLLGTKFVKGEPALEARVRGPIGRIQAHVSVSRRSVAVVGQHFDLPAGFDVRLSRDTLTFEHVHLGGPEASTVEVSGHLGLPARVQMHVRLDGFPIGRIPGLADTALPIAGRVSGDLDYEGSAAPPHAAAADSARGAAGATPQTPRIFGQLAFGPVTFQGRPVGGGTLVISEGRNGGIRAHGEIIDGVAARGELVPERVGFSGEATIDLERLHLDPFLPVLPGGLRAAGILSGRLVARVAPGRPPAAAGTLRELALRLFPSARTGTPATSATRPVDLHADGGIRLAAEAGGGPVTIGPARFAGDAGTFELYGESRGPRARATLRGRLEMRAFASLVSGWSEGLTGSLDADVAVSSAANTDQVTVTGAMTVAKPIALRLAALPVEARISAGSLRLDGDAVTTRDLAVSVRASRLAGGAVRDLEASGRIEGRLSGTSAAPAARARIAIDKGSAQVSALGPRAIVSEGGHVAVESDGKSVRVGDLDLPVRGEARGLAMGGARIDAATYALRLRGDSARHLALTGEVELLSGRVSASAARSPGGGSRPQAAAAGTAGIWSRPEIENTALDVRVRSRARTGALVVDVPKLPDLRVDLDMHVGGTVKHPLLTGEPRGANLWSRFVLAVARLFR